MAAGYDDHKREIKFEELKFDDTKGSPGAESHMMIPIIPAELLAPFELPIEGSQIANVLRNQEADISLERALELVEKLSPMLRPEMQGMVKIFERFWQIDHPALKQPIEWLLVMSSSFYDPDIVTHCTLNPYRLLVNGQLELSNEFINTCLDTFKPYQEETKLLLRLDPGAGISFPEAFLAAYSLKIAMSDPSPSNDTSFCDNVSVFRDTISGLSSFSVPSRGGIDFDERRSTFYDTALYGTIRQPTRGTSPEGAPLRWDVLLSLIRNDATDGRIAIKNNGEIPLKVLIRPGPHQKFGNETQLRI
jgi:hypothetical protein